MFETQNMNFEEPEETALLRETIRRFVDAELPRELARELDAKAAHDPAIFKRLCALGVAGLTVPAEYGGSGQDILSAIVVIEELAKRGTSLAGPFIHCAFYGSMNIVENGSESQKREYLPKLARGELLFAYGLSEPNVGGDLASAAVTAQLSGDGRRVIINGTKRWCTGARIADIIYTLVRSGPKEDRYHNLSIVLVPTSALGISVVDIDHVGLRYSETTDVIFEGVEVPAENIVGGSACWNKGWPMLVGRGLDVERLEITAVALGVASAAVEDAWQYAQEREQFGRKICGHQAVRNMLVEARTKLGRVPPHALSRRLPRHGRPRLQRRKFDGEVVCRRQSRRNRAYLPARAGGLWLRARIRHGALCARHRLHAYRWWLGEHAKEQHRQSPWLTY